MPLELEPCGTPMGTPEKCPTPQPDDEAPRNAPLTSVPPSTAQALWEILHGISLPKTPKAMTCTIPLISLHRARALIDSIVNDTQLTSIVAHLALKIDKLEGQMGMSCKVNSPPHTHAGTTASQTENTMSCDYATIASMTPTQSPVVPNTKDIPTSPNKVKNIAPMDTINQPAPMLSITPPVNTTAKHAHDQIIVRFVHPPALSKCLPPRVIRDMINEVLHDARVQISVAEYTQAGNVSLIPHALCTTEEMLQHSTTIAPLFHMINQSSQ
jgi:hypothetical protein